MNKPVNCNKYKSKYITLTTDKIVEFLKKVKIFSQVDNEILISFASNFKYKVVSKGEIIFQRGEPSSKMYIIYSGSVAEFVEGGIGVEMIVKTRKKYAYFGELGMFIDEAYLVTAMALENSILIYTSKEEFLKISRKDPSINNYIIRVLIKRLVKASIWQVNSMYLDAPGRLAFKVIKFAQDSSSNNLEILATQSDLAKSVGMARQTVAKILSDWRKEGWITTIRGKIIVKNKDALMNIITIDEI